MIPSHNRLVTMKQTTPIEKLNSLADWMDSKFKIPGTNIRFGLDSLFGLIPGIGDTVTLASTIYILGYAQSINAPWHIKARIIWNGFIDWIVGLVPLIGDIFDIGWKSNRRNVKLLQEHIEAQNKTGL